ncbi:mannose-1-phosphate guanylyltransferase/mannose-6-phosphate isomerase [Desulfofustis limnaeus]|jgi:mannose-1-phosphate guanylyltransferase/mannose-1-phosphate guanylyltransferase/mannose-6-phosphate isomerase|uniref:mannose-1-phosphate guanylyltransferase n=1 Tax=Desulfofustis limnaeus TaxID=2740163 RepID=A0ABN6M6G9_9BACT|nr:mannose-1-phosphate guanylyltransferase/mannose-6-phosphate isomerase [Desulfofustis limnaeus]MDX9895709.1 mannose-1-phosphate guanylyltransferase/mannose-6-phosphate isomerase [Desulfofustis sp.]BDD88473.1 GDP-mannose pyrophosphorylase [Desulfofustis limnaeus]
MNHIQPVILAGGTGSRLWPLSREIYPKQLLCLTSDLSLLQNTLRRVLALPGVLAPLIVVGEEHRFITKSQVDELGIDGDYAILLEPTGRNTAPAISGAVEYVRRRGDGDPTVILVLPADHLVRDEHAFAAAVAEGAERARAGAMVTFGIHPRRPETGYGYIERGADNRVTSFKEKPAREDAERYCAEGNYYWNSGMFAFTVPTFRKEMAEHAPQILASMDLAVAAGVRDDRFFRFGRTEMARCPEDSIDYALMEKTGRAEVVAADLGWSDIGSWQALYEVLDKDANGNVSQGDVLLEDTRNSLVRAEDMMVAAVGLEDTLVVETADAVLVAPLSRSQDVKKIVARLKREGRDEFKTHQTVHRPWGCYSVLAIEPRYQIKRITVNAGQKLSLQMHHHRYEHWVVVKGTARVTNGSEEVLVYENQSVYIPAGNRHRLENPGVIPLELIEVQIGSYLGEDDIVRFDDIYGRHGG